MFKNTIHTNIQRLLMESYFHNHSSANKCADVNSVTNTTINVDGIKKQFIILSFFLSDFSLYRIYVINFKTSVSSTF